MYSRGRDMSGFMSLQNTDRRDFMSAIVSSAEGRLLLSGIHSFPGVDVEWIEQCTAHAKNTETFMIKRISENKF